MPNTVRAVGSADPRAAHRVKAGQATSAATQAQVEEHLYREHQALETADRDVYYTDGPSEARLPQQLAFMEENISKLGGMLVELSMKLEPILIPEMDEQNARADIPVPSKPASELSNQVDELNGRIRRLQNRVAVLHERVQL